MRVYNTLSRSTEDVVPIDEGKIRMYSCGPTVYDHIHIGNLSAFIAADMLRRALQVSGYEVSHVMNFTDVDDKTIRRSGERFPDISPEAALNQLTTEYKQVFLSDMASIGNDTSAVKFVSAVDTIEGMRAYISDLFDDGFAYITDDGVYFSIQKYRESGKKYGQLLELDTKNTSSARINNDEYDKESVHDFALWKVAKPGEPAWEFELGGKDMLGRPGWHIECSVMSVNNLGQPFDIHTGGIDLIFPHHENEIAQSTAGGGETYAKYFVHNEHLLVDGKKMSKSLNNFFTLRDIQEKGYDPLDFRLMMLQAHYRSQTNFTWENLDAAHNRLQAYRAMADQRFQLHKDGEVGLADLEQAKGSITQALLNDLNTPLALKYLSEIESSIDNGGINTACQDAYANFLEWLDQALGLSLSTRKDVTDAQKKLLVERQSARDNKAWQTADSIRNDLRLQGIEVLDTELGQVWKYLDS